MSYQLIITNVPMINGNKKTISIRCDDPLVLTWNKVFDFMEENKSK